MIIEGTEMAFSLALIMVVGLSADAALRRLKLPGLIGMLAAGMLLGPFVLDLIYPAMYLVSEDFRMIALIVILLSAGFELRRDTLHRVGGNAVLLGVLPAAAEIGAVTVAASIFLGLPLLASAVLGAIFGASSPLIVTPKMIDFMARGKGGNKGVPTLIMAGSSVGVVFAVFIFTVLMDIAVDANAGVLKQIADIPVSIITGAAAGIGIGLALGYLFKKYDFRPPQRTVMVLGASIGILWLEVLLENFAPMAGLLSVMIIGFIILQKEETIAHIISSKLKSLWIPAELLLFVLVGAQVDLGVVLEVLPAAAVVILAGMAARTAGVYGALRGSNLNSGEKLFAAASMLPKAAVQAAIGAVPLAAGLPGGETILAASVIAIILTTPIAALSIPWIGERVLASSLKPVYRFKDLRVRLHIPRVGQRLRNRETGNIWKVIEEKELWLPGATEGAEPSPGVELRIWLEASEKGKGPTETILFTPDSDRLNKRWEVVFFKA